MKEKLITALAEALEMNAELIRIVDSISRDKNIAVVRRATSY